MRVIPEALPPLTLPTLYREREGERISFEVTKKLEKRSLVVALVSLSGVVPSFLFSETKNL